jgi:hypothetical protein
MCLCQETTLSLTTFFPRMLLSLASALGWFVYCLVDDVVSLPMRPWVLFDHVFGAPFAWLTTILDQSSLVAHVIASATIVLVLASFVALCEPPEALCRIAWTPFLPDACVQLYGFAMHMVGFPDATSYSLSHTSLVPLLIQIPMTVALWTDTNKFPIGRYAELAIVFASYLTVTYVPRTCPDVAWLVVPACYILMCLLIADLLLPREFATMVTRWLEWLWTTVVVRVAALAHIVYTLLVRAWPHIASFAWRIFTSPPLAALHRWLLEPVWRVIVPFIMPSLLLGVAISMIMETGALSFSHWSMYALAFAQVVCAASTLCSSVVLFFDVISSASMPLLTVLSTISHVLGMPWVVIQKLCSGRITRMIARLVADVTRNLMTFAIEAPILAIPVIIVSSGVLFYLLFVSPWCSSVVGLLGAHLTVAWHTLQSTSDTTLIVVFVALIQTATYYACVTRILQPALLASRYVSLPMSELRDLAATMSSPRQCACCRFGPVDHTGCSNLMTHHEENGVSNACPRCGWLARNLSDWPAWEDYGHEQAATVYTRRAWAEFVLAIRATAKATVIPLVILRVLHLSPTVGALVALSYLGPWLFENVYVWNNMYQRPSVRARRARAPPQDLPVDCGARAPVYRGEGGDTLASLLAEAAPARIFVGESCSVCLDDWTPDVVRICEEQVSSASLLLLLRNFEPPCLALRCGHLLHQTCAQDIVQADAARHQRCPLCRQPLTFAGAVSAGMFN